MARVLVPVANASEDIETSCIVDILRRASFDVVVASVEDTLQVTLARGMQLVCDARLADVSDTETFDVVALPGGMPGAERLRDCAKLTTILTRQAASGRWIAAVCASPAVVLVSHGLISVQRATAHANFITKIPNAVEDRVVVDAEHRLITSRGPGTSLEFALAIVSCVGGRELAAKVAAPLHLTPDQLASIQ